MPIYRFGDCALDTGSGELRRGGRRIRLRPQPAAVLEYLLRHPGEVVSREDLRRAIWPEGTFVHFDHGLNSCVKQLRAALGEDRVAPRYIETLTRRGYRFVAAVTAEGPTTPPTGPEPVRIVVLPFARLTNGDGGHALADGLTEDVSVRLTNLDPAGIRVLGPVRGFPARSDMPSLPAAFAVSGSVRVVGQGFRVTAQLTLLRSREQVWAGVFDGDLRDVFRAQASIADRIATAVAGTVRDAHGRTAETTGQADAVAV
jgi:DNA-binding winged helix-turn-helix (wHTH) protein